MPTAPKKIKRPWQKEYKTHQRVKDMSWFYNSWKWRKFTKRFIQSHPLCVACEDQGILTPATVTDHILTFEQCPEGFDLNNLKEKYMQPMCKRCHDSKSGKEAQLNRGMG